MHAGEEAAHVALWDQFAGAAGSDGPQPAEPETEACAAAWAGDGRDLLGHLVALYAIESAQPAISRAKADGLREHYGFASGPATAYFDLHGELDREHAAEGRELIVERDRRGRRGRAGRRGGARAEGQLGACSTGLSASAAAYKNLDVRKSQLKHATFGPV